MRLVGALGERLASREKAVVRALELQRHPPPGKVLRLHPRGHFLAEHFQLRLQFGLCAEVGDEGCLAGDALRLAVGRHRSRIDAGREVADG